MADITKINLNGTSYTIVDSAATSGLSAEITRAQAAESANTAAIAAEVVARQSAITAVETVLSGKADQATTLSGYGITDAYTSAQTNTAIANATSGLQETLTAGTGIQISGNVISCTIDAGLYVVVQTLPAQPAAGNENKIHLVPLASSAQSQNDEYEEYLWKGDAWEYLGVKQMEIDLSDYWDSAETQSQIEVALIDSVGDDFKEGYTVEGVLEEAGIISISEDPEESEPPLTVNQVVTTTDLEDALGSWFFENDMSVGTALEDAGILEYDETQGEWSVQEMQKKVTAYYDSTTETLVLDFPDANGDPNA